MGVVLLPEHLGVVGDAVLVIIVLHGGADGLFGQDAAVDLMGGQTVQSLDDRLVGELEGLFDGLALDELGGR